MAEVGTYYVTIMPDMSGFSTKILKELDSAASGSQETGKSIGGGMLSGMGNALSTGLGVLMGNLATQAASIFMSGFSNGVQRLDTLSIFPKVMENLGFSSDQADASLGRVSESIIGLPTSLDDAASAVQRLTLSTGDIDRATDVFIAFNNALVAGAAPMSLQASALEQFSQSVAKGKPDMLEWRTLMNAMPAQLSQIAMSMGMTASELGEGLRQGTIPMDDFLDALITVNTEGVGEFSSFEEQVTTATGTIGVALKNVENRVSRFWASILDGFGQENIVALINGVSMAIVPAGEAIGSFIGGIIEKMDELGFGQALEAFGDAWGALSDTMGTIINEDLIPLAEGLLSALMADDVKISWESLQGFLAGAFTQVLVELTSTAQALDNLLTGWVDWGLFKAGKKDFDLTDPTRFTNTSKYGSAGTPDSNAMWNQMMYGDMYTPPAQEPEWVQRNNQFMEQFYGTTEKADETVVRFGFDWTQTGNKTTKSIGIITRNVSKMTRSGKSDIEGMSKTVSNSMTASFTSVSAAAIGSVQSIQKSVNGLKGKTVPIGVDAGKSYSIVDTLVSKIGKVKGKNVSVTAGTGKSAALLDTLSNKIAAVKSKSVTVSASAKGGGVVDALASKISKVGGKSVTVSATTSGASSVDTLASKISGVKSKSVVVSASTSGESTVDTLKSKIDNLPSKKSIELNVYKTGISSIDVYSKSYGTGFDVFARASGGIVTAPQINLVGEAGAEAIVPLTNPTYVRPFAQAIAHEMGGGAGSVIVTGNNFYVRNDGDIRRIAQEISSYTNRQMAGRL